jgi:hypothetical protein
VTAVRKRWNDNGISGRLKGAKSQIRTVTAYGALAKLLKEHSYGLVHGLMNLCSCKERYKIEELGMVDDRV